MSSTRQNLLLVAGVSAVAAVSLLSPLRLPAASVTARESVLTNVLQLHGEITWRGIVAGRPSGVDRVTRFSVIQQGCRYRIDQMDPPYAYRQSFYYDGTNWYTELVSLGNLMASNSTRVTGTGLVTIPMEKAVKPNPTLAVSLMIEPLLRRTPSLFPVWLAFGGTCHFANEMAPEIPSVFLQKHGPLLQFELVRADRVFSPPGGLERYTDYWNEPSGLMGRNEAGLTNIAFHVLAWTNVGSVNIPASFRFVRYFLSPNEKPPYYQSMDGSGRIMKVERLNTSVVLMPTIATNTYVVHFRSHEWEPVTYVAVDGQLKTQQAVDEDAFR